MQNLTKWMILGMLCIPAFAQSPEQIVAAADRSEADRKTDERRKPLALLKFLDLKPGMRVMDMGAGGGYTSELIMRSVGENGVVYAQNPKSWEKYSIKMLTQRQESHANLKAVWSPFDDPNPDVKGLDMVTMVLIYHDTVNIKADRAKMNQTIFNMLKPGGYFVIVDHNALEGAGVTVTKTLHRIEESVVRKELEAAGFELAESADFLRNADDTRDYKAYGDASLRTDRFALKFRRPK